MQEAKETAPGGTNTEAAEANELVPTRTETEAAPEGAARALKRRGLFAAAAALLAGLAAKQMTPKPAEAAQMTLFYPGAPGDGQTTNTSFATTNLNAGATFAGSPLFQVDGRPAASNFHDGIYGYAGGTNSFGVFGQGSAGAFGVGVQGTGGGGSGAGYAAAGVRGFGGNAGGSGNGGAGVLGTGGNSSGGGQRGPGVEGDSLAAGGIGVLGTAGDPGAIAVLGHALPGATNGYGVLGSAEAGIGVQGQAFGIGMYGLSRDSYGILGVTTAGAPFSGITGVANTNGAAAFAGGTSNPLCFAAYFTGSVVIDGSLTVLNPANKHGAAKHPDGSHRLVYSMESPESWIEDFGSDALVNGRAQVKLDPDFVAIADTSDYHAFFTAKGDCKGLYISRQDGNSFEVRETNSGKSYVGFSWRVVAKPRTEEKVERLKRFEVPNIKIPGLDELPPKADTSRIRPAPADERRRP